MYNSKPIPEEFRDPYRLCPGICCGGCIYFKYKEYDHIKGTYGRQVIACRLDDTFFKPKEISSED